MKSKVFIFLLLLILVTKYAVAQTITQESISPTVDPETATEIPLPTSIPSQTVQPTVIIVPSDTPTLLQNINPTDTPVLNSSQTNQGQNTNSCDVSQGDANCDGQTTFDDFIIWKTAYANSSPNSNADFNRDGIKLTDFIIWKYHFTIKN